MSSTNRKGNNPKRATFDYYPTPSWAVHRFLEVCPLPGGKWLEPCAGDGAIIKAVNEKKSSIVWSANEIQTGMQPALEPLAPRRVTSEDYLQSSFKKGRHQVIITNPPFTLAMECIRKSFELEADYVVFLLRLNFLASKGRASFMKDHTPDVYVLSQRPAFTLSGQRDSIDYAWFVWDRSRVLGSPGKLVVIPGKE